MTIEVDNDDFLASLDKPTKGNNMSHSRIAQQIEVLTLLESTIGNAGKVTMTPTRVKIMSEHREGNAFNNQKHLIDLILQRHGMLPFTVELVPHG